FGHAARSSNRYGHIATRSGRGVWGWGFGTGLVTTGMSHMHLCHARMATGGAVGATGELQVTVRQTECLVRHGLECQTFICRIGISCICICLCFATGPPASCVRLDDPPRNPPSAPRRPLAIDRPWAKHGSNPADWRFVFYLQLIDARLPSNNNSHMKMQTKKLTQKLSWTLLDGVHVRWVR
ncbi:hypothetical protein M5D96_012424, partial [Drosophila gunungcola]